MNQVLFIHGGTSFNNYERYLDNLKKSEIDYDRLIYNNKSWKNWLASELKDENIDFLTPNFPNKQNAQYEEWVLYFKKILPYLNKNSILVGYSLGATFLAKYFSENESNTIYKNLILLAPAYNDESTEDLGSFKIYNSENLFENFNNIVIFHSEDDPIVNFNESKKFIKDNPNIKIHSFKDYGHFFIDSFPELLNEIKRDSL